jgi:hypothetical protein
MGQDFRAIVVFDPTGAHRLANFLMSVFRLSHV